MSVDGIAICNYIRFKARGGEYIEGYNFQNFFVNERRTRDGLDFIFAPFAVTAGAATKGGDRSDSALISLPSPLAMNLFVEASVNQWLCEISVVLLDPATFDELNLITQETWTCSKPETTTERAILRLASPLDAVDGQVPKRTLSTVMVGSLPSTGNITVA